MNLPTFTMRQLLEAGVHYGHTTRRWNPKMAPFIFGARNGIHIINLEETVPNLYRALEAIRHVVAGGGRVLFVGTKPQASEIIKESAKKCGQYYINHRWLGGMLTNWKTVNQSIKRLKEMEAKLSGEDSGITKKERLGMQREYDKLELAIGGIREMGGLPDILFVIDTNKEAIAIKEAHRLSIPVVGILDSNSDPEGVTYPIPGNDDALRAIRLYCDLVVDTVLDGLQAEMSAAGYDLGASVDGVSENLEGMKVDRPARPGKPGPRKHNAGPRPGDRKPAAPQAKPASVQTEAPASSAVSEVPAAVEPASETAEG